jgi:nucleoside 2-deoxyribosyltransferase
MDKTMIKIYFAGKVYKTSETYRIEVNQELYPNINDDVLYKKYKTFISTGPIITKCDHGCFHGENQHGALPTYCHNSTTRHDIFNRCMKQIDASDVIFASIGKGEDYNNITCYGTLNEIGYAYAKNKVILIVLCNNLKKKEKLNVWFAVQASLNSLNHLKDDQINDIFNIPLINNIYKSKNDYINNICSLYKEK